jgi:hypothetical protein
VQVLEDEDAGGVGVVGSGLPDDRDGDLARAQELGAEADAAEQARAQQHVEALLVAEELDRALAQRHGLAPAAALGEEAFNFEEVLQHVRGDPRLVDQTRQLGRPGDGAVIDRGAGPGRGRKLDPLRERGLGRAVPQAVLARELQVALVVEADEVGGEGLAAAVAVLDRQRGAEDVPHVVEGEAPALAGALAQRVQEDLGGAHAVLAWRRTASTGSASSVTWRSPVRRSRWELRRRIVFGSTAIASASSTPVV